MVLGIFPEMGIASGLGLLQRRGHRGAGPDARHRSLSQEESAAGGASGSREDLGKTDGKPSVFVLNTGKSMEHHQVHVFFISMMWV